MRRDMYGLYAILDPDHCLGRDPLLVARTLLKAGVSILQLRVKDKGPAIVADLAKKIMALKREYLFTFIINDYHQIVLESKADGLHFGQGDLDPLEARKILGPRAILGLSTHDLEEVEAANDLPLNYIGFGAIFPTLTKDKGHPVPGLAELEKALALSRHPIVAIGGITGETLASVLETGASSCAILSALTKARDIGESAQNLLQMFKTLRAH